MGIRPNYSHSKSNEAFSHISEAKSCSLFEFNMHPGADVGRYSAPFIGLNGPNVCPCGLLGGPDGHFVFPMDLELYHTLYYLPYSYLI